MRIPGYKTRIEDTGIQDKDRVVYKGIQDTN